MIDLRSPRLDTILVVTIAVVAAMAAGFAPAAPTGLAPADAIFRAGAAALVTFAAARARTWANLVLAGAAFAVAHDWQFIPAGAGLLLSFAMAVRGARLRLAGAVVGAVSIQVLFHQGTYAFQGASSLVGAAAATVVLISAHRNAGPSARQRHFSIVAASCVVAMVATTAFGVALILARHDLETGASRAKAALAAARAGEVGTAERELDRAGAALRRSASLTGSWWAAPARAVPIVGQQAEAVSLMTNQARAVVRSARVTTAVGDYRSLKYRTGRFDLAKLRQLRLPIADSAATLDRANQRLAALHRGWLLAPLRDRIDDFAHEIARAAPEAKLASSIIDKAPALLGGQGTRHYFVAFTTPAELRGGGGLVGNFGELTAKNGRIRLTRSGPIRELVDAAPRGARHLLGPAEYLRRYGAFRPADHFLDVMFSPHFPFDASAIEQLYPQSGGEHIDGVISIDPVALAALLRFTGPIVVPGLDVALTADNAADILLRTQYLRVRNYEARLDLLVEASRITFDRLTRGDLPAPKALGEALGPMVAQRRIMFNSIRPGEQRLFETLHADGALPTPHGRDVLSIASDNMGNNKIDAYLHRDVAYDATIDPPSGNIQATATVTLRNDAPSTGLPPFVIGNSGNVPAGTNLMSLSVYSPLQLIGAALDGHTIGMQADREAGLHVYTVRLAIPPKTTQKVRLVLAGAVDLRHDYRLVTSPQPVANIDRIRVTVRVSPKWQLTAEKGLHQSAEGATSGLRQMRQPTTYQVGYDRP